MAFMQFLLVEEKHVDMISFVIYFSVLSLQTAAGFKPKTILVLVPGIGERGNFAEEVLKHVESPNVFVWTDPADEHRFERALFVCFNNFLI